jgi:hypothetical protein
MQKAFSKRNLRLRQFCCTIINFGGPHLPNGLLQKVHFWASCSLALCLQYQVL